MGNGALKGTDKSDEIRTENPTVDKSAKKKEKSKKEKAGTKFHIMNVFKRRKSTINTYADPDPANIPLSKDTVKVNLFFLFLFLSLVQ